MLKADNAIGLFLILSYSVIGQAGDWDFFSGDYSKKAIIGQSLPGTWRPFATDAPWNMPIPDNAKVHPESDKIIYKITDTTKFMRLAGEYNPPVWVVNAKNMPQQQVYSKKIFDAWDQNRDQWSDITIPIDQSMWAEPTSDGHMIIIDPFAMTAWEMSRFKWEAKADGKVIPTCTTFNVWDLKGKGYADLTGKRWQLRGGRGSGFPIIAGMVRLEEVAAGEIRHALVFTFPENRQSADGKNIFIYPPAVRSDGKHKGREFPIEGMRLQLDPKLTEADFDAWRLTKEAKVVAKALQKYGMFLGDNGGAMALQVQMLANSADENKQLWDKQFPNLYQAVAKIPTAYLKVIDIGKVTVK
jgi:hypothetical protein